MLCHRAKQRQLHSTLALVVGACVVTLFLGAGRAEAISAPIHIHGTGGEGVFIRPQPNTSQPAIGWMPEGASPDYNCFVWGQNINGVPIWFDVNYNGVTGYYASYYDDSSYRSNAELTAKYGVPLCGSAPPPAPSPAPPSSPAPAPSGGLVFPVFNAEGGIYYRYGPHWSETTATPGVGVYNGDEVELICGAYGDAVGPYADTAWSKVRNLSRPVGEGWVNEHYINDGAPSNSFVTGEPMCQPGASAAPAGGSGGSPQPSALYYSPYPENPHGSNSTGQIKLENGQWVSAPAPSGTTTLSRNQWDKADAAHCPDPKYSQPSNPGITTLAAWSEAHAAPFLLLQSSTAWLSQIHYILLFDPGTQAELDDSPCDRKYEMGLILQKWLTKNPNNRFVILSAEVTADRRHSTELGLGHAGIQDIFFTPLKVLGDKPGQPPRTQIVVCNYDTMSHEEVWRRYSSWIVKPPITLGTCPPWPGHKVVAWNP